MLVMFVVAAAELVTTAMRMRGFLTVAVDDDVAGSSAAAVAVDAGRAR